MAVVVQRLQSSAERSMGLGTGRIAARISGLRREIEGIIATANEGIDFFQQAQTLGAAIHDSDDPADLAAKALAVVEPAEAAYRSFCGCYNRLHDFRGNVQDVFRGGNPRALLDIVNSAIWASNEAHNDASRASGRAKVMAGKSADMGDV
jgi:hypothetical protein